MSWILGGFLELRVRVLMDKVWPSGDIKWHTGLVVTLLNIRSLELLD